ncbi:FtsQ-type POTRA domain-containing protein [Bifidobacteriaceae bacterium NR047]|nr:FtsQ-type POTRA domain-containing protein [Bifidobacteriaceae bacterium NR047]
MGSVKPSESDDSAANKPHPRTVSSLNLARAVKSRITKSRISKSYITKPRTAKSHTIKQNSSKSGVDKSSISKTSIAKPSIAKPSIAKPSIAKTRVIKTSAAKTRVIKNHLAKPRSIFSIKKSQREQNNIINQRTDEMRVVSNKEKHNQGSFVDARLLPKLDFVKKTLSQTSGSLGMMTRPRMANFRERLKERKSAYLQFTLKRLLIVLLVAIVASATAWLLFFSPIFLLKSNNISISGSNEWVSKQRIYLIASTQVNKSLFLVSSQEVIGQLNDIPGVTEAKVTKDFPHGLNIVIRAQRPAAMLKTKDSSRLTAVDAKGRVLNAVANVSIKGIPVIEVANGAKIFNNRAVLEAVKIVSSLPESMRARVTKVSAKTQDSVETELGDIKRTIIWGNSSQLELKKAIVAKIIDDPSKMGDKKQLDVSSPVRPILK